jgi:hypothetical protein
MECLHTQQSPMLNSCFLFHKLSAKPLYFIEGIYADGIYACQKQGKGKDLRKHCVAAPFNKLSIVAQTTTLFPLL